MCGAAAAFAGVILLGPRAGKYSDDGTKISPDQGLEYAACDTQHVHSLVWMVRLPMVI